VVPIVVPILDDKKVVGFLDLIEENYLMLGEKDAKWNSIEMSGRLRDQFLSGRQEMFSKIADSNDKFADIFLQCEDYSKIHIYDAISG
jgi:hypothetical protein